VRKAIVDDVWKGAEESRGQFLDPVIQLLLVSEAFARYANGK
jgi:hypothetical protein